MEIFLFLIKRKDTISFMVKSLENLIILRHILTREKKNTIQHYYYYYYCYYYKAYKCDIYFLFFLYN